MEQWLSEELSRILGFDVPEDLIRYVLAIGNEQDLHEYMKTLLDFENQEHKKFFVELSKKKFHNRGTSAPKQKKKISKSKPNHDFVSVEAPTSAEKAVTDTPETKEKKKTKYVNLYSQEGENAQVVLLKGRHHCDCEAAKHDLVNNCLECGRIVCTQEGSGPCLFCGNLVCTPEEEKQINSKTKNGAKLMGSLLERDRPKGWEAALAHRNKLLDFERNSEQRTHVTDDDSDYFNTSSVWLSASEKDKLERYQQQVQEKKHASRLTKKMTFDFAGRQIVEEKPTDVGVDEDIIRGITAPGDRGAEKYFINDMLSNTALDSDRDVAPGVNAPLLQYDPSVESGGYAAATKASGMANLARVQDAGLLEMSDAGRCLSMHQPWASLLVEGIKLHEGRTWYSAHRGRLWIASTAKPPDADTVRALENQYRVLYPDKTLNFPSFYPTGCLLGCVNVDDCLPLEEYQELYPDGESDSPYVFICSNPVPLRLRFPIKGQHKIYTLDKSIHLAAIKCIQNMAKIEAQKAKEANAG